MRNLPGKHTLSMVNIVHIISGDLWAGAESQAFHTLSDLSETSSFSVAVILFNDGILAKKLQTSGVKFVIIDEKKYNGFTMLWKMTLLLRRLKPKIVHVHAYKEHVLGKTACKLSNIKANIIRTFHGRSETPPGLSFLKTIKSNTIHKIEKLFMQNCNLIAVSKDLETTLSLSFPDAFVTQIYNGLPVPEIKKISKERIRAKYSVEKNVFWIGTVARLEEIKNLGMLINAGIKLKGANLNFRISIFGEGQLKRVLQDKINQNSLGNNIFLEGFVDNIMPLIASFDLFVLCSLHEGLPMSLLEAMFAEVPVICTSVGGMKEVITNRYTGLLVPSNDARALSESIIKVKNDSILKNELIENAKIEVEEKFLIQITNQKLAVLYNQLAAMRLKQI